MLLISRKDLASRVKSTHWLDWRHCTPKYAFYTALQNLYCWISAFNGWRRMESWNESKIHFEIPSVLNHYLAKWIKNWVWVLILVFCRHDTCYASWQDILKLDKSKGWEQYQIRLRTWKWYDQIFWWKIAANNINILLKQKQDSVQHTLSSVYSDILYKNV